LGDQWLILRLLATIGASDRGRPVNFSIRIALAGPRVIMIAEVASRTTGPIDGYRQGR
jgi:hypothetical protein